MKQMKKFNLTEDALGQNILKSMLFFLEYLYIYIYIYIYRYSRKKSIDFNMFCPRASSVKLNFFICFISLLYEIYKIFLLQFNTNYIHMTIAIKIEQRSYI